MNNIQYPQRQNDRNDRPWPTRLLLPLTIAIIFIACHLSQVLLRDYSPPSLLPPPHYILRDLDAAHASAETSRKKV